MKLEIKSKKAKKEIRAVNKFVNEVTSFVFFNHESDSERNISPDECYESKYFSRSNVNFIPQYE